MYGVVTQQQVFYLSPKQDHDKDICFFQLEKKVFRHPCHVVFKESQSFSFLSLKRVPWMSPVIIIDPRFVS